MILKAYNIEILLFLDDVVELWYASCCLQIMHLTFFPLSILVKFCHTADVFDMDGRGGLTVNETLKIKMNIQQTTGRWITWTLFNLPVSSGLG